RLVLLITAASLCVSIQGGLYFGVLSAMQRLDLVAVADIVFELMRAALVVLVLSAGGGLLGLALIGLALGVLRFWFVQSRAASVYPELGIRLALPAAADVRMILSVSAYSTLIYTSLTVVAQAKTLIIGATLPMTMVAFYAIGTTLPGYANALNRPIAQTVHPRASRCDAIGDIDGLRRLVLGTGRYSALILGPVALTFLLRGESFIGIWMGREFREMSGQVLSVLALAMLFTAPRHVVQAAFVGSGRHKALAPWYILEAATVLALSLILIPRFGIVGAAFASAVPSVLMTCLVMPALCGKLMDMPALSMAWSLWLRPLLAMLPFAVVTAYADISWPASDYLGFFSQVALCLPLAAAGAWLLALQAEERLQLLELLRVRLGRG
ncbi:MAG: lipopolysaccharide biosynthesis protein, partial [Gammaproteobacteria bacterium]